MEEDKIYNRDSSKCIIAGLPEGSACACTGQCQVLSCTWFEVLPRKGHAIRVTINYDDKSFKYETISPVQQRIRELNRKTTKESE